MAKQEIIDVTEQKRLNEARGEGNTMEEMGTLSQREAMGAPVREDYSEDGNAWDYFTMTRVALTGALPLGE